MNLLDAVLNKDTQTPETLRPVEAFTAIVLMATVWDSYLTDEEEGYLMSVLLRLKPLKGYSQQAISQLLQKNLDILRRYGINTLFNLAKASLSPKVREAAFAVAVDLVLGEGIVTIEEKIFLNDLSQALDISPAIATQILQLKSVKNI